MAATDLERLLVQFDADTSALAKKIDKLQGDIDGAFGKIVARGTAMESALNNTFGALAKGAAALGVAFSLHEVIGFIDRITEAADRLQALSARTGIGVEQIQKLSAAGRQANVSTEAMSEALDHFARSLGQASAGQGDLAKVMAQYGIPANKGMEEALLAVADAVKNAKTRAEEFRITQAAFGRSSAELVTFLRQGSAAIREQADAFKGVITKEENEQLAEFAKHWKEIQLTFSAMAARPLAPVLGELASFLKSLDQGTWFEKLKALGNLTAFLVTGGNISTKKINELTGNTPPSPPPEPDKPFGGEGADQELARREIARTLQLRKQAEADLARATGEANAAALKDTQAYYDAERQLAKDGAAAAIEAADAKAKAEIASLDIAKLGHKAYAEAVNNINLAAAADEAAILERRRAALNRIDVEQLEQARASAEKLTQIENERQQALQRTATEVASAQRDAVRAADDVAIELARGTSKYFEVSHKALSDELAAQKAVIAEQEKLQIDALQRLREQRINSKEDGIVVWKDYEEAVKNVQDKANLEILAAENKTAAERHRLIEEETQSLQRQIETMDKVRSGLEDVGIAALHGSKSFKQAVADMLKDIAEMILRLYVLRPLIESVLGRTGTTGGGLLGTLLGVGLEAAGVPGGGFIASGAGVAPDVFITPRVRAGGGPVTAGQPYIVGEKQAELFVPDVNGTILPSIPKAMGAGIVVNIRNENSFAGAVDAKSIMTFATQAAAESGRAAVDVIRKNFPALMIKASRDNL